MNLIIFDIDGTLTDSTSLDDGCYRIAVREILGFNITDELWADLKLLTTFTDSGITNKLLGLFPEFEPDFYYTKLKDRFHTLLENRLIEKNDSIVAVPGAVKFMNLLISKGYSVAVATGSWFHSGRLKLKHTGFPINGRVLASADDSDDRKEIIKTAVKQSEIKEGIEKFDKITYFGDGEWDYISSAAVGIDFIGVDYRGSKRLNKFEGIKIISDYTNQSALIKLLD